MWRAWFIVAVVACRGSDNLQIDAGHDAGRCPRPAGPECGFDFAFTCGNGVIDNCIETVGNESFPLCPSYYPMTEECDGMDGHACSDVGYFGGAAACSSDCHFDASGCSACAIAECVTSQGPSAGNFSMASNTGHIALAYVQNAVTIFDDAGPGLEPVVTTTYPSTIEAMVGVPNGWLVKTSTGVDIHALANDGTQLADNAAGLGEAPLMVYGPGGHALLVGKEIVNSHPDLWAAVIDANANTIVAPFVLAPPSDDNLSLSLATDGTSFFVGTLGQVMRLDANANVVSVATGFPNPQNQLNAPPVTISWSGTTGWYVIPEDLVHGPYIAQPFDASGAPVGMPISIDLSYSEPVADGDGLLAITATSVGQLGRYHLQLVRLDATGAVVSTTEFGAGDQNSPIRRVPFDASHVAISWQAVGKQQLALVMH